MEMSEYDETRATARLPNLDIEILHRRPWEGNEEQLVVMLRAVPSFEAVGRWLEASNPLSRLDADDGSGMVAVGARAHHSPLPELQTTIPAWFRSWLPRPSRSLKEQAQRSTMIEGLSAITLATHDMRRAVRFYQALGFEVLYGGEAASFTSFRAGTSYLNLIAQPADRQWSWWGRVIFYVADVDELYERARAAGFSPATAPRNAEWGERYFHLTDPDGHELSFARPLPPHA